MRIIVTPAAGAPRYLKVSRTNSAEIRQPFDGAVLERPDDFMTWQTCSDVIAHSMARMVRNACPLATVEIVA